MLWLVTFLFLLHLCLNVACTVSSIRCLKKNIIYWHFRNVQRLKMIDIFLKNDVKIKNRWCNNTKKLNSWTNYLKFWFNEVFRYFLLLILAWAWSSIFIFVSLKWQVKIYCFTPLTTIKSSLKLKPYFNCQHFLFYTHGVQFCPHNQHWKVGHIYWFYE